MSVVEITSGGQLQQLISQKPHTIAVLDFYATWCGPCIASAPRFAAMAQRYVTSSGPVHVVFCKIDVDRNSDIQAKYEIRAMPTFKILFDGDVEDTITGADLGAVESKLGILIQYAKSKAQPAAAPAASSSAPQDIYPTGEPVSPLGRMFIELQRAIETSNAAAAAAASGSAPTKSTTTPICERIFQFLVTKSDPVPGKAVMPFGLPLLAYFLSDSYFSPQAMEAFLTHIANIQGQLDATHFGNSPWTGGGASGFTHFSSKGGVLSLFSIVGNLTSFVTSALGKETWNINDSANFQLNHQRGPLPPGVQAPAKKEHYDGKYHRVVRRMLGVPTFQRVLTNPGSFPLHSAAAVATAATTSADNDDNDAPTTTTSNNNSASMAAALVDMLTPHPLFLPTGSIATCQPKSGGKLMERQSILGALLSPGIFPSGGMTANLLPLYLGQLFNPGRPFESEVAGVKADVHARMSAHFEMTFPILRELLSKKSYLGRSAVLQWISAFLTANSAFGKEMHDKYDTASHSAMLVLMHVLVELGLPVVSSKNFELSIPAGYLLDLNADLPAVLGGDDGPLYEDGFNIRPESAFRLESNIPASTKKGGGNSEEAEESTAGGKKAAKKPEEVSHSGAPLEELRRRLNQRSLVHFSSTANKPTDVERVEHLVIPALLKAGAADPDSDSILPQPPSNLVTPSAATLAACAELSALLNPRSGDAEGAGGDTAGASALDSAELHKLLYTDIESNVGVQIHAPKVHLFYFALRAISLAQTPLLLNIKTWKRHLEYPQVDNRQKEFLRQRIELSSAMLTCPALSLRTIRFVNGVSKWLLHILLQGDMNKGNTTTGVPTVPTEAWKYLPQVIFDTIFTTLELVTSFEIAKVEHSDINDILGLMLLLMGNLSLFPKAHSHIPFPTIILKFLEQPHMRDMLTRHPWFQSQIIMGCVRTYMAMEGCGYDRVPARYYISCILRILLKDDGLAYAARPLLEDVSNGIMERFTHMVTSEANSAIDTILENLIKMRKLEEAGEGPGSSGASSPTAPAAAAGRGGRGAGGGGGRGGRGARNGGDNDSSSSEEDEAQQEGGEESYAQLGSGLKQSLFLFSATIDAFKALSEQYPKGILQNLVAQQIANMLARSLIKLAGPNSKELKISNPDQYNFKPREILTNIVECLVRFKHEETFIRLVFSGAAAESPPDGQTLFYAIDNMLNPSRPLVFGMAASDLASIKEQLLTASKDVLSEDELWGEDPPEFALCALMQTPLRNPIALPTSGDDLTFVEGDVIHHALLKEEQNPFTRAKLTTAELEEFNATPRVQEALVKLKADIAAYLVQRRAELGR